jgi:hypothetical protein
MKYYYIEPEVAGWPDPRSVVDLAFHPPIVKTLSYEFEDWLGDVLIEGFPCWLVTIPAMRRIRMSGLTGIKFDHAEITTSKEFKVQYPQRKLPDFVWLKVLGIPGHDDFGVPKSFKITGTDKPASGRRFRLVISGRALNLLKELGIPHAEIEDYDGQDTAAQVRSEGNTDA